MHSTVEVEREALSPRKTVVAESRSRRESSVRQAVRCRSLSAFSSSLPLSSWRAEAELLLCHRQHFAFAQGTELWEIHLLQRVGLKQGMGSGTCWLPLNCCMFDTFE